MSSSSMSLSDEAPLSGEVFQSDDLLIFLAKRVLSNAGYHVENIPGKAVLLAENKHFILGLTATATVQDIEAAESVLAADIQKVIQEAVHKSKMELGYKSWDIYLVLLTRQALSYQYPSEGRGKRNIAHTISEIRYDTSRFRRIVRVGVSATESSVRRALVSFLDLPEPSDEWSRDDPFELLRSALVESGIAEEKADRAVAVYAARETSAHARGTSAHGRGFE